MQAILCEFGKILTLSNVHANMYGKNDVSAIQSYVQFNCDNLFRGGFRRILTQLRALFLLSFSFSLA